MRPTLTWSFLAVLLLSVITAAAGSWSPVEAPTRSQTSTVVSAEAVQRSTPRGLLVGARAAAARGDVAWLARCSAHADSAAPWRAVSARHARIEIDGDRAVAADADASVSMVRRAGLWLFEAR